MARTVSLVVGASGDPLGERLSIGMPISLFLLFLNLGHIRLGFNGAATFRAFYPFRRRVRLWGRL